MFDRNQSGTLDIHEFKELNAWINQSLTIFKTNDLNGSGQIDESQLE